MAAATLLSNSVFLRNLSPLADESSVRAFLQPVLAEEDLGSDEILSVVFKYYENSDARYCEVQLRSSGGVTCATKAQGRLFLGVPVTCSVVEPTAKPSLPLVDSLGTYSYHTALDASSEIHRAAAQAAALAAQAGVKVPCLPGTLAAAANPSLASAGLAEDGTAPVDFELEVVRRTIHVEGFPMSVSEQQLAEQLATVANQVFAAQDQFQYTAARCVHPVSDLRRSEAATVVALIEWQTQSMADAMLKLNGQNLPGLSNSLVIIPARAPARHIEPVLVQDSPGFAAMNPSALAAKQLLQWKVKDKMPHVDKVAARVAHRIAARLTRQPSPLAAETEDDSLSPSPARLSKRHRVRSRSVDRQESPLPPRMSRHESPVRDDNAFVRNDGNSSRYRDDTGEGIDAEKWRKRKRLRRSVSLSSSPSSSLSHRYKQDCDARNPSQRRARNQKRSPASNSFRVGSSYGPHEDSRHSSSSLSRRRRRPSEDIFPRRPSADISRGDEDWGRGGVSRPRLDFRSERWPPPPHARRQIPLRHSQWDPTPPSSSSDRKGRPRSMRYSPRERSLSPPRRRIESPPPRPTTNRSSSPGKEGNENQRNNQSPRAMTRDTEDLRFMLQEKPPIIPLGGGLRSEACWEAEARRLKEQARKALKHRGVD